MDKLHRNDLGNFLKIWIAGLYIQEVLNLLNDYNVQLVCKPYTGLKIARNIISQNVKGLCEAGQREQVI